MQVMHRKNVPTLRNGVLWQLITILTEQECRLTIVNEWIIGRACDDILATMWRDSAIVKATDSHKTSQRTQAGTDVQTCRYASTITNVLRLPRRGGVRSIAISVSVCVSVCPLAYFKNHMSNHHETFCTYYLWPWLGPPLTTLENVMSLRFLWMTSR